MSNGPLFGNIILISLAFFLPFGAKADTLKRDGILRLYHSHLNEWMEVTYEKGGVDQPEGIRKINHFLRSRDSGKSHEMDLELIHLLDHLQDHFGADTVEVICGYRSPEFNRYLRSIGRSAAENSYHMRGLAADIHMDEIVEKDLHQYVRKLKKGGAGYYPDNLMVHVDVGRVHSWQQGKFTDRRDIGEFNQTLDLKLTTNRLFYFLGDKLKLQMANPSAIPLRDGLDLEHFFRGKWDRVSQSPFACHREPQRGVAIQMVQLDCFAPPCTRTVQGSARNDSHGVCANPTFGKYRWKAVTQDGRVQYSNEFYLKRK